MTFLVLNSEQYHLFKRVLESALESTEQGLVTIENSDHPLAIHSLDALYTCQNSTRFAKKCFTTVHVSQSFSGIIDIKALQTYVWKCKKSKVLKFKITNNEFVVSEEGSRGSCVVTKRSDHTPYDVVWNMDSPSFRMSSYEFGSILLDLSVGGTEALIETDENGNVYFSCQFESGTNKYVVPPACLLYTLHAKQTSGPYIVKFLKSFYSMGILCVECNVKLYPSMIIIQQCDADEFIFNQFIIHKYVGPRRIPIAKKYLRL